jgi:hypothetical protein
MYIGSVANRTHELCVYRKCTAEALGMDKGREIDSQY